MKLTSALKTLQNLDRFGVYVLSKGDLSKAFPDEQEKAFEKSLQRLVNEGVLERVAKGVYLNPTAQSKKSNVAEDIAVVLRRGHFSYVSLESSLSEYGVISQVPIRTITIMTTGAKGSVNTPYGTIEFTHTKRSPAEIVKSTLLVKGRPLRVATKATAVRDLLRVGRNTNMITVEETE